MEHKLIRSISDSTIERFTGKVRHYDRFDYVVGELGPFSVRVYDDEFPTPAARVQEADRQMREHASALSALPH